MALPRPAGRQAGAIKYDILTALSVYALTRKPTQQRQVLRLMALITARYNWQRDELSTGQREIAALWDVDERTVKRDMARLRAQGWLVQKRKGARGRVSVYGLGLSQILADTQDTWSHVGPDFEARLRPETAPAPTNVVPLRHPMPVPAGVEGLWPAVQCRLAEAAPAVYQAWFAALVEADVGQGVLRLLAPSAFHANYVATHYQSLLTQEARRIDPAIAEVRVDG